MYVVGVCGSGVGGRVGAWEGKELWCIVGMCFVWCVYGMGCGVEVDLLKWSVVYDKIVCSIRIVCKYLKVIVCNTICGSRRVSIHGKSEIISSCI